MQTLLVDLRVETVGSVGAVYTHRTGLNILSWGDTSHSYRLNFRRQAPTKLQQNEIADILTICASAILQ